MFVRKIFIVILTLLVSEIAVAKEVPFLSKIDRVTIFPSQAEVTRVGRIKLEKGAHQLVIKGLPEGILGQSIRVKGTGSADVQIGSVDHKRVLVPENKEDRKALEESLNIFKDKLALQDSKIKIAESQKRLMENLSNIPGQPVIPMPSTGDTKKSGEDWGNLFDLMGQRLAHAYTSIHEANVAKRKINEAIAEIERQLAELPRQQKRDTQVRVNIQVSKAGENEFELSYQLYNAGWRPVYEARLLSVDQKGKVQFVRKASIHQRSGEKWENVKLSLSTTQPDRGTSAPNLYPIKVDYFRPQPKRYRKTTRGFAADKTQSMEMAEPSAVRRPNATSLAAGPSRKVRLVRANVKQSAFQVVFEVPGRSTIEHTGEKKQVLIMDEQLEVPVYYKATPRKKKTAYLYTGFELKPNSPPVLPGTVALFRQNVFVGNGRLPQLVAKQKHELGFGADDKVKISYAELDRSKGESGLLTSYKTDTRQFKSTIENLHANKIEVRLLDQLPFSEEKELIVEPVAGITPVGKKNVDDKRGIYQWTFKIPPSGKQVVNFGYKITWPKSAADRIVYSR